MSETKRTRIGREYEVLAELGSGGMGEVLKARHRRLNRLVALKILPSHLVVDDEARARFEREARAGAQLEHDHIVTTYDVGIYDGRPYLAVSFVEGETLTRRIQRAGRLDSKKTVEFIAPIAEALAYAHRKGIIHRDVKTSNIMIRGQDERPFLIDFGIALSLATTSRLTRIGDVLGTPEYMSPEQASAQQIDIRSDIYSLGIVLYECLTGTVPFLSPHTEVLLANIKYEPHRPVRELASEVSGELSAIVDKCLAKKPTERFQSGDDLASALRETLVEPKERLGYVADRFLSDLGGLLANLAEGEDVAVVRSIRAMQKPEASRLMTTIEHVFDANKIWPYRQRLYARIAALHGCTAIFLHRNRTSLKAFVVGATREVLSSINRAYEQANEAIEKRLVASVGRKGSRPFNEAYNRIVDRIPSPVWSHRAHRQRFEKEHSGWTTRRYGETETLVAEPQ